MQDRELEKLLADLESDRTERKASDSDRDKIRKAICAFANDLPDNRKPGVIFVGANNDGSCANLDITDGLLLKLSAIKSEGKILPLPSMTVKKMTLVGCDIAVVIVEPQDAPPVRLDGHVFVRVGPSTQLATPDDERRLSEKRRAGDLPFDIRPLSSATFEDIDFEIFQGSILPQTLAPELLKQNQRSIEQQLASLRFSTPEPDGTPTFLGVLAAGKDPRQFIPGAYIQFLRYDGLELTSPIKDQKEIDGPLPDQLRMLDETLNINISSTSDITSQPVEISHSDYPIVALQQLTRNAVLHRNYDGTNAPVRINWFSDRVEIQNPGGPFGQVTRDNFGSEGITDYRNPHLAEVMKNLGYVQRFGLGIPTAHKELEKNGNPPLDFVVEDSHVLAIVKARR